jgi:RNA polymerase sigma-70 factor (ECF subfamily)
MSSLIPHARATDRDLIVRAQSGDARAVSDLIRRHSGAIERVCHRMCRNAVHADDVVQETYVAILHSLRSFRGDARFLTWVYTLARTHRGRARRSETRDRRRHERLTCHGGIPQTEDPAPDDVVASKEMAEAFDRAFDRLPAIDCEILRMRMVESRSAQEIAARMGLTVPAVKTRLHRARVFLRRQLENPAGPSRRAVKTSDTERAA